MRRLPRQQTIRPGPPGSGLRVPVLRTTGPPHLPRRPQRLPRRPQQHRRHSCSTRSSRCRPHDTRPRPANRRRTARTGPASRSPPPACRLRSLPNAPKPTAGLIHQPRRTDPPAARQRRPDRPTSPTVRGASPDEQRARHGPRGNFPTGVGRNRCPHGEGRPLRYTVNADMRRARTLVIAAVVAWRHQRAATAGRGLWFASPLIWSAAPARRLLFLLRARGIGPAAVVCTGSSSGRPRTGCGHRW